MIGIGYQGSADCKSIDFNLDHLLEEISSSPPGATKGKSGKQGGDLCPDNKEKSVESDITGERKSSQKG